MKFAQRSGGAAGTLLLAVSAVAVFFAAQAEAIPYTIPDSELMNEAEFVKEWGDGSLDSRSYLPVQGVQYTITLGASGDGKTAFGDNWQLGLNLGWDDLLYHYTSLADYDSLAMTVRYVSGPAGSDIDMHLFMNTGLTGPSGNPSGDTRNDTFWGGAWANVALGEMVTVVLDFDLAESYNAGDNPEPHTQPPDGYQDGDWLAINMRDRNEVSHFGFEIADFDGLLGGQQILMELNVVPEPAGVALLLAGLAALARRRHS